MEYKVGDFVKLCKIANGHGSSNIINSEVVRILDFIVKFGDTRITFIFKGKNEMTSMTKIERLASIEEIQEHVKDNNYTINQILEVCNQLYPKGIKIIPIGLNLNGDYKIQPVKGKIEIFEGSCVGTVNNEGFLYVKGRFARLVDTQEDKLPFKVGDRFTAGAKSPIYTIEISENTGEYQVSWYYLGTRKVTDGYYKYEITKYFKENTWKHYISQLKKEDFYNTKIDVSESEELFEQVQQVLFELGFKWPNSNKNVLKREVLMEDNIMYILKENIYIKYSQSSKCKQIYPQDLGININQTINNNNNNGKREINQENNSISKVQGFNQQISSSSGTRGIGLTSSRSKITLGAVNKPNKVGLSTCK